MGTVAKYFIALACVRKNTTVPRREAKTGNRQMTDEQRETWLIIRQAIIQITADPDTDFSHTTHRALTGIVRQIEKTLSLRAHESASLSNKSAD